MSHQTGSVPHHSTLLAALGAGAVCWGFISLAGCSGSNASPPPAQTAAPTSETVEANSSEPASPPVVKQQFDEPELLSEKVVEPAPLQPVTPSAPIENAQARAFFETLVKPGSAGEEWEQAHQGLLSLGEDAVSVLAKELAHKDVFHRETAAMTLALLGTPAPDAIEPLKSALLDQSEFVRANVATALVLSAAHADEAIPVLLELLKSSDPQLRIMAATNLSAVGEEIAPHADELAKTLSEETTPEVLLPIVELLGRLGPAAKNSLPELERISFEQQGDVKTAATQAISLIRKGAAD